MVTGKRAKLLPRLFWSSNALVTVTLLMTVATGWLGNTK
jgi:hypothetical protein